MRTGLPNAVPALLCGLIDDDPAVREAALGAVSVDEQLLSYSREMLANGSNPLP